MTKSAVSPTREICGLLGVHPKRQQLLRSWNDYFRQQSLDAVLIYYPTKPETIPERLSEMFHFDRRFYIIAPPLRQHIAAHLDKLLCEPSDCTFVCNTDGVLIGSHYDELLPTKELLTESP